MPPSAVHVTYHVINYYCSGGQYGLYRCRGVQNGAGVHLDVILNTLAQEGTLEHFATLKEDTGDDAKAVLVVKVTRTV